MEIKDMNLIQVTERLAALDEEVRAATDKETIENAVKEKYGTTQGDEKP